MLARRIKRDVEERGRDVSGIIEQYLRCVHPERRLGGCACLCSHARRSDRTCPELMRWLQRDLLCSFVKPSYDNFVLPSSKFADIVRHPLSPPPHPPPPPFPLPAPQTDPSFSRSIRIWAA